MGLFSFLTGKMPEEMELDGDNYVKAKEYGAAKVEFEKALNKAEKKFPEKQNLIQRLYGKIRDTKEALAVFHKQTAERLANSENYKDADDLFLLALELSENVDLKSEISAARKQLVEEQHIDYSDMADTDEEETEPFSAEEADVSEDEYFSVLCNAMPGDVREAYHGYGHTFKQGFVSLNHGDFETAAEKLSLAMEEFSSPDSLIPVELATALINLEQYDQAGDLLEQFVLNNPEEVRGYQMLCDIFWISGSYDKALSLIDACPDSLKETFSIQFLLGETFYQMARYPEAEKIFQACLDNNEENEIATRSLAKTYEAMGELKKACDIYAGILNGCTRCGTRTDPYVKRRYAELCFASEERTQRLLEVYLSLVQEDPDNKNEYFQRIQELYIALGNKNEARRYESFMA